MLGCFFNNLSVFLMRLFNMHIGKEVTSSPVMRLQFGLFD